VSHLGALPSGPSFGCSNGKQGCPTSHGIHRHVVAERFVDGNQRLLQVQLQVNIAAGSGTGTLGSGSVSRIGRTSVIGRSSARLMNTK